MNTNNPDELKKLIEARKRLQKRGELSPWAEEYLLVAGVFLPVQQKERKIKK